MSKRIPHPSTRPGKRVLAWGLTVSMLCPPVGGLLSAAQAQSPVQPANNPTVNGPALPPPLPTDTPIYGANSILLFPFGNDTNSPSADAVAARVADAVKLRLSTVGDYKVTSYSKFLAPVQRALDDNVLSQADITGPFDAQKGGRIASQFQTNEYLTGAVESFTADPNTRRVTIEVSADLRSTQTGNSVRSLAFTGTGVPVTNSDSLDAVTQRAVNAVASKIASAINAGAPRVAMALPASQRGHNNAGQIFLLTVLAGALVYAVLHNSNNTNGSNNGGTTTTGGGGTGGGGTGGGIPPVPAPPSPP